MKRMGGLKFINCGRLLKASTGSILTVSFLVILVNLKFSHSFKTMTTVHKLSDHDHSKQPVSYNQVPLLWRPEPATKSVAPQDSSSSSISGACETKMSAKCRKTKKKNQEKVSKFSSKNGGIPLHLEGGGRTAPVKKNISVVKSSSSKLSSNINYNNLNYVKPPQVPQSFQNLSQMLTPVNILEINKFMRKKRHYCKLHSFVSFTCKKLKWSLWLAKQMDKNVTKLNGWLEIVRDNDTSNVTTHSPTSPVSSKDLRENIIKPSSWPEKIVYRLIKAWGDPEDLFVFYKYKDYVNTRELKISLPYQVQLKVSPKKSLQEEPSARSGLTSPAKALSQETARWFWDPGFNLKLKLPFFRDELKVAVSTGPSFVAGIGVGIAVLIIKSMFAPFLLGTKWMMYNLFFKESSPFDLMKMFFHMHSPAEPWDASIPPPAIDHYRPPPMHNPYDSPGGPGGHSGPGGPGPFRGGPPGPGGPGGYRGPPRPHPHRPPPHHHPFHHPYHGGGGVKGFRPPPPPHYDSPTGPGPTPYELEYSPPPPYDLHHQFTQPTPMISTLAGANPTMSQLEQLYRAQLLEEGLGLRRPNFKNMMSPDPTNSIDIGGPDGQVMDAMGIGMEADAQDTQAYIPSNGLQAEVEHFDPFYSPLLSKIDSIFTHLGHQDEGCRERVVCSIYKFPVKYAPYSNLLSAQLSKHQSELKRPVSSSTKILRYFRYMKAAKDGQGGENCGELYPKCDSDTDSVSSLPMITTFHQLSELMTAEASSPSASLVAAQAG